MTRTTASAWPLPPTTDRAPSTGEPLTRPRRIRAWATVAGLAARILSAPKEASDEA
jgi:hypothetical protein